jgi:3-methyl-2-oxobutanoate hydroxymethyltransferase
VREEAEPMNNVSIAGLQGKKRRAEKISALTVYDYPFARLADEAGIDCLLVSDVLGQVGLGYDSTVPVTLEEMVHHTKAVIRGTSRALVLAKMPFLSSAGDFYSTLESAERLIKEAGARGLEVEGGAEILPVVAGLVQAGIPVMPHIGATVQAYMRSGTYRMQGTKATGAKALLDLALQLEEAGAFAVMLECVPAEVAERMSARLQIPVIGIGSGAGCDGQILVSQDLLGLFDRFLPKFVKVYRQMGQEVLAAFREFREEVRSGAFPGTENSTSMAAEQLDELRRLLESIG